MVSLNKLKKKAVLVGLHKTKFISDRISYPLIKKINGSNLLRDALNIDKYEDLVRLDSNGITCLREDNKFVSRFKANKNKGHNLKYLTGVFAILAALGFEQDSLNALSLMGAAGTVTDFNPDQSPETNSVAGRVKFESTANTFTFYHDRATGSSALSSSQGTCALRSSVTFSLYLEITRGFALFDTSILGADTISDAVMRLFVTAKTDAFTEGIDIVSSTPASDTNLVTADFDQLGSTSFANIAIASITTSAYNDFTLDAGGISNIDGAGISKFGQRITADTTDTEPTWIILAKSEVVIDSPATAGQEPELRVTHSGAASFTPKQTLIF